METVKCYGINPGKNVQTDSPASQGGSVNGAESVTDFQDMHASQVNSRASEPDSKQLNYIYELTCMHGGLGKLT